MNESPIDLAVKLACELCIHFEGFSAKPYLCPAGYWTIGYGTVYKPDGTRVTKDHPVITKEIAYSWLVYDIRNKYMAGVLQKSPGLINNYKALAALTDFAYNLGVPRYSASTLAKRVNESNWSEARREIARWNMGGGKVLPGLVLRRKAEANLLP